MKLYTIYIIECNNGTYYTGYTTDIERRYAEHVEGSVKCKYTRANPPKRLAVCWEFNTTLSDALRIENAIKKLSKKDKCDLIQNKDGINRIIEKLELVDINYCG